LAIYFNQNNVMLEEVSFDNLPFFLAACGVLALNEPMNSGIRICHDKINESI
jgi:hypothetical protein